MKLDEKILLFEQLNNQNALQPSHFYDALEACDALKANYCEYMITAPVDCNRELLRLPDADYDLCCALLTMLLREDHFDNGQFAMRQRSGQVQAVIDRILTLLRSTAAHHIHAFSEKAQEALNGFYVYALADPRDGKIFYIGKGTGNRVFDHEAESAKQQGAEKKKLQQIREIEAANLSVKRLILHWGLSESEALAAEAALINALQYLPDLRLTNEVSGHHAHECLTAEEFEAVYGAIPLKKEDIRHGILVIKINRLYRRGMEPAALYDAVRGYWAASLKSIEAKKVRYVFGVYNGLIVAVYRPDEWHYGYEMIDAPQREILAPEDYEKVKNRLYFVCKDYQTLDEEGWFYLNKSIVNLKASQSAQNPITYLTPEDGD